MMRSQSTIRQVIQRPLLQKVTYQHIRFKMADEDSGPSQQARPSLTHFLCIPLVNETSRPQLQDFLDGLRSELPDLCAIVAREPVPVDRQLISQTVRPLGTIHLTLGVMSLATADRVREATEHLENLQIRDLAMINPASDPKSEDEMNDRFTVSFNELDAMKSPANTSVVFLKPAESCNGLLAFCEAVRKSFMEAGFLVPEDRPLKLHATVVNTIYAKFTSKGRGRGGAMGRNKKGPLKLNVIPLLARYEHMQGIQNVKLEKLAICKMGAKKQVNSDGEIVKEEYEEMASILLLI